MYVSEYTTTMCEAVRCILTCINCIYHFAQNEGMTGVISTNGVFSRLTFALYEDSGYVLNRVKTPRVIY